MGKGTRVYYSKGVDKRLGVKGYSRNQKTQRKKKEGISL